MGELGVKGPLEYLLVSATTLVSLLFIYMIPIDCKVTKSSLYLYGYYSLGQLYMSIPVCNYGEMLLMEFCGPTIKKPYELEASKSPEEVQ